MNPLQTGNVNNALRLLTKTAFEHRSNIQQISTEAEVADSDEKNDSQRPVLDHFYKERKSSSIKSMTSFFFDLFEYI